MGREPLDDVIFIQLLKELLEKVEEYSFYLKDHPGYKYLRNVLKSSLESLESFYRP